MEKESEIKDETISDTEEAIVTTNATDTDKMKVEKNLMEKQKFRMEECMEGKWTCEEEALWRVYMKTYIEKEEQLEREDRFKHRKPGKLPKLPRLKSVEEIGTPYKCFPLNAFQFETETVLPDKLDRSKMIRIWKNMRAAGSMKDSKEEKSSESKSVSEKWPNMWPCDTRDFLKEIEDREKSEERKRKDIFPCESIIANDERRSSRQLKEDFASMKEVGHARIPPICPKITKSFLVDRDVGERPGLVDGDYVIFEFYSKKKGARAYADVCLRGLKGMHLLELGSYRNREKTWKFCFYQAIVALLAKTQLRYKYAWSMNIDYIYDHAWMLFTHIGSINIKDKQRLDDVVVYNYKYSVEIELIQEMKDIPRITTIDSEYEEKNLRRKQTLNRKELMKVKLELGSEKIIDEYKQPVHKETKHIEEWFDKLSVEYRNCIFRTTKFSLAFWQDGSFWYLYNPYRCDEFGYWDDDGYACIMKFCTRRSLKRHLMILLLRAYVYDIPKSKIEVAAYIDPTQLSQEEVEEEEEEEGEGEGEEGEGEEVPEETVETVMETIEREGTEEPAEIVEGERQEEPAEIVEGERQEEPAQIVEEEGQERPVETVEEGRERPLEITEETVRETQQEGEEREQGGGERQRGGAEEEETESANIEKQETKTKGEEKDDDKNDVFTIQIFNMIYHCCQINNLRFLERKPKPATERVKRKTIDDCPFDPLDWRDPCTIEQEEGDDKDEIEKPTWLKLFKMTWMKCALPSVRKKPAKDAAPRMRWHQYLVEESNRLFSLWGELHITDGMFDKENRGLQAYACYVVCAGMTRITAPEYWTSKTLDVIVMCGDRYYTHSKLEADFKSTKPEYSHVSCWNRYLMSHFKIGETMFEANVLPAICGRLYAKNSIYLWQSLEQMFLKYHFGILTCESHCLGVFKFCGAYYMCDVNSFGSPLFQYGQGAAYLLRATYFYKFMIILILTIGSPECSRFALNPIEILKVIDVDSTGPSDLPIGKPKRINYKGRRDKVVCPYDEDKKKRMKKWKSRRSEGRKTLDKTCCKTED
ncbi:hypothetical protein HZH68_001743 [Vespula germanica]|uniref:Uncharacterized protein n=1 Tax=Vespula germanica TaxID=30212 RepID=A0A834NW52_VESGE|nr:hypothetical protein HZH68_001743 [Vespula germanica]